MRCSMGAVFALLLLLLFCTTVVVAQEEEVFLTPDELGAGDQYIPMEQSFYQDVLPIIMTVVLGLFMLIIIVYYFFHLRKALFTKHMDEVRKKSLYVMPDFNTLPKSKYTYIGLVADTNVKTYLDHRQLNTHTLIAGGTGSGKTMSGMIIVEELLNKGLSVVVFDPVGQWTGFVERNRSKRMLELYHKFSLKRSMAFNATIIDVNKATIDLDILHYIQKKGLTILKLDRLEPGKMDQFIEKSLEIIHHADLPEEKHLNSLLVLDEVHRLLPKYGGRKAYLSLEQAVREFRKWGIGLLMVSQVLTDFKGAIRGNIGTEIQMRTRYEGDLRRVRQRNGPKISRVVPKMAIGTGMVESIGYNKGQPYFVEFRPPLHSPRKLTQKDIREHLKSAKPVLIPKGKTATKPQKAR